MDEPQIYARLGEIFRDVFDEDSITVTPALSVKDVDGWDTGVHMSLANFLDHLENGSVTTLPRAVS